MPGSFRPIFAEGPIIEPWVFFVTIAWLVILLVAVALFYRHPSRPCSNCGKNMRIMGRRCPHCGYRHIRFIFR